MKKKKGFFGAVFIVLCILLILIILFSITSKLGKTENINNYHFTPRKQYFTHEQLDLSEVEEYLTFEILDDGEDIYNPKGKGYRYGPSIIKYEDGTIDAWFARNGNNSTEWDWISYRHFDGETWSDEEVVLKPTKKSKDHYSVCDPGVIYFNGYYYLGYTSTENSTNGGVENCIYVARSENPNGPFEKWNGKSWGKKPEPIIVYDEDDLCWGAGEISFVIVDEELYCYYTWIDSTGTYTKLAVANLCNDWPTTLIEKGTVITKINGQGSCDVAYNDEYGKFLAFCSENSFQEDSLIALYESNDGINFIQVARIDTNVMKYCHNLGISKSVEGHINMDDDVIIGYAYSKEDYMIWGKWATRFHHAKLKLISLKSF